MASAPSTSSTSIPRMTHATSSASKAMPMGPCVAVWGGRHQLARPWGAEGASAKETLGGAAGSLHQGSELGPHDIFRNAAHARGGIKPAIGAGNDARGI